MNRKPIKLAGLDPRKPGQVRLVLERKSDTEPLFNVPLIVDCPNAAAAKKIVVALLEAAPGMGGQSLRIEGEDAELRSWLRQVSAIIADRPSYRVAASRQPQMIKAMRPTIGTGAPA